MPGIAAFAVMMILGVLAPLLCARGAEPAKMFHVGIVAVAPGSKSNLLAFEQRLRGFTWELDLTVPSGERPSLRRQRFISEDRRQEYLARARNELRKET
jgi:hypothetical protein